MSSIDTINVLTLDISRTIIQTIRVKQYDANSRHILITVVDNGVAIDLNDYRVVFEAKTADNRSILNTCDIQEDGKALVVLTDNALYSSGKINAQLNIIASDSSLSTMPFYIQVVSSTVDPDEITPSDEFSALNDALIYVENIKNEFVLKSQMGVPTTEEVTGIATLDENGQVVEAQLPSYVDDILEGIAQNKQETPSGSYAATEFILTGEEEPCTPETGKIYMDTVDEIQYRWSGSVYISVGSHLGLGETSSTAYPGDRGKANADAIAALSTVARTGSYNDLLNKPVIKDSTTTYDNRAAIKFEGKVSITDDQQNNETKILIGSDKFYNTLAEAYADIENLTEYDDIYVNEDSNTDFNIRVNKIRDNEASEYNPLKNYKIGDFCIYDNIFYRCISDITKYTKAYIVGATNLAFNWLSLTEGGTAISQSVGVADSKVYKVMTSGDYYGKYYIWDENLGIYKETIIDTNFDSTKWVKDTIGNNLTNINNDLTNINNDLSDIDDMVDDLAITRSKLGAKNLLPYPYYQNSKSMGGITWTVNADGSVTASGTLTERSYFPLQHRTFGWKIAKGTYILSQSGLPSGAVLTSGYWNGVNSYYANGPQVGVTTQEVEFEVTDTLATKIFEPFIDIPATSVGTTFNFTVYPMIRLSTDHDSTYQPYAMTNKELTDAVADLPDIKDATRTNLLNLTAQTQTKNGVTLTNNGDGTYTVNGTASGGAGFIIEEFNDFAFLENKKLVGCPAGGSSPTWYMYFVCVKGTTWLGSYDDYGNGVIVSNIPSETTAVRLVILVREGVTVNNLLFKPMLTTDLNATYDDFVRYSGTGKLNDNVAELYNALDDVYDYIDSTITQALNASY